MCINQLSVCLAIPTHMPAWERTAQSTYQSCKNGHLFACTSLWSVAEGPDICRQSKMSGIFKRSACVTTMTVWVTLFKLSASPLWQSKQLNPIAFDDQYAVADAACVYTPYRDRQYFHCGVPDLVPWVLLVSTAKQEPANKNLELIPQVP